MRIVGGIYKGRTLVEFKGKDIRPTHDMVRESLFNILQFKISGATFLDLFSGTGAMGIEALSRHAKSVTFNDFSRESINVLKKNLEKLGVKDGCTVSNGDAITFLKNTDQKFDVVYIDPPYKTELGKKALEQVCRVLNVDGIAVFEDEKPFIESVDGLIKYDERKYGRAYLTFFKKDN